jgi:hypothetical protein
LRGASSFPGPTAYVVCGPSGPCRFRVRGSRESTFCGGADRHSGTAPTIGVRRARAAFRNRSLAATIGVRRARAALRTRLDTVPPHAATQAHGSEGPSLRRARVGRQHPRPGRCEPCRVPRPAAGHLRAEGSLRVRGRGARVRGDAPARAGRPGTHVPLRGVWWLAPHTGPMTVPGAVA